MYALRLVPLYLWWHYTRAFADMFRIAGNLYWFLWHFFSIPETFKTFFEPWQRLQEKYHRGLDLEAMASTFIVNFIMRILGVFMRTFLLLFAVVGYIILTVTCIASFFIWVALPPALIFFMFAGVGALFK